MRNWIPTVISRYKSPLTWLVLMQLGCGLLVSVQPRYFQQLVSLVVGEAHSDLWARGLPLLGWLGSVYLGIAVLQGLSGYVGSIFSTNLLQQLQKDFFEKTSQLPLEHFRQQSAGEFFTTFANDIGQAQRFFADFLPGLARELITATAVTLILFYFCPAPLTFAAICIVIVVALLVTILNRLMGHYARAQRAGWGEIHRVFDETVQGIDTLKVLAAEKRRSDDFQIHTGALRELSFRAARILSIFSPGIELLAKLGGLGVIAMAYSLISKGELQVDPFLVFFFYATLLQMSVSNLSKSLATIQTEFTGVRRLAAFLGEPNEPEESHLTMIVPSHSVTIELSGVSFAYPGGRQLYSKADLVIPARAVTLLHGKSGSGKSTLINLLLRFYEPEEGLISMDGIDIRQIRRAELRRKIGVVTQHHFIFQETLRANLLIAQPDATDSRIVSALERAQLEDFLVRLPQGINTVMDPQGRGMSAGEKQRICVARLLLRQSPMMILDEPWTNLDLQARELLAKVINSSKETATILVLSHERLQTLAVDRIYHLNEQKGIFVREDFLQA
jgi:ABC-type multidrug transport system fused ATPase/permease subunit